MKITQVYRTRNGIVGPTNINGYGVIKINGLRYDKDENKYYDSEDNEVILEEGREYYSNNKLYVYDGKLTELLTDLMIEVKYNELVELRNNEELIPGVKYRIIDYQCTTTQENTKSAGHQFDIVLLALSENKLAEEGWAMMHDNIYDVTFADGVTKKCYLYVPDVEDGTCFITDKETLLGTITNVDLISIDEETKTASTDEYDSVDLENSDLPYNYFQNSKLEAWKVWYCLDNDKSRFAWADDSKSRDSFKIQTTFNNNSQYIALRDEEKDREKNGITYYAWSFEMPHPYVQGTTTTYTVYTDSVNLTLETVIYNTPPSFTKTEFYILEIYKGEPNGRGVIYRLIDEWNNDVPYDFKNMMFKTYATDGYHDDGGALTFVYTFSAYDTEDSTYKDGSMLSGTLLYPDDVIVSIVKNNTILGLDSLERPVILLDVIDKNDDQSLYTTRCFIEASGMVYLNRCQDINVFYSNNVVLSEIERSSFYNCNKGISNFTPDSECVMINNKNVLVES